ncbi:divalent cation tolerance protein [Noviherbaspirillum humi]|uniref:Divalent cation tolerance protein n=1 Tax=Noviherbaspirillum humi TaxID=1688639 RepID=A0A239JGM7_9BURK|nr:divalent-cation tolerance protein CutA [Noviherbaspirillum humi]SNT04985.1 divalent cation tolerance protein [Noviherbaspirillum humi]
MSEILIVLTNLPDGASAQALARHIVEQRLAACVNILPGVRSLYRWQGAVEEAAEVTLLIKTPATGYDALETAIRQQHPYDVPEVVAIPVSAGLPAYLAWVADETRGSRHA